MQIGFSDHFSTTRPFGHTVETLEERLALSAALLDPALSTETDATGQTEYENEDLWEQIWIDGYYEAGGGEESTVEDPIPTEETLPIAPIDNTVSPETSCDGVCVPGDMDTDGDVDFEDFLSFNEDYGSESSSEGDFNNDGIVDFADFLIFSENYGA